MQHKITGASDEMIKKKSRLLGCFFFCVFICKRKIGGITSLHLCSYYYRVIINYTHQGVKSVVMPLFALNKVISFPCLLSVLDYCVLQKAFMRLNQPMITV